MPIALPVTSATASANSPASAFSAVPAAGHNAISAGSDRSGAPSGQSGQGGDVSSQNASQTGQSAQVGQNTQAAQNAQSDTQSPQNVFARMLDAQLGSLEEGQSGQAVTGAGQDGSKPSRNKTSDPAKLAASADPLPNPAWLLMQPAVPVVPVVNQNADQPAAQSGQNNPLSAAASGLLAQGGADAKDAKQVLPGSADKAGDLFQALSANAEQGLQKLPPSDSDQSTNLPQQLGLQVNAAPQREQQVKPTFTIPQPVGTPAWGKALGDQMLGMVTIKAETAHIQLNPPELGPIDVTLKMDGHNNAQVTFNADSAATRAALQDSLPRLHSMMAASGIQLGDAQVSGGQSQQQQQNARNQRGNAHQQAPEGEEFDTLATIKAARGVLSIFA